jgi:hypothetical protein
MTGWADVGGFAFCTCLFCSTRFKHWSTGVAVDFCVVICGFVNIQLAIYDLDSCLKIESLNDIRWPSKAVRRRKNTS